MKKLLLQILLYVTATAISGQIILSMVKIIPANNTALIILGIFGIFTCLLLGEIIGDERKKSNNERVY